MRIPLLLLALLWQPTLHATTMTIGTGGARHLLPGHQGVLQTGQKVTPTMPCKLQASSGSIENLRQLKTGEVPYALVQSDWLYQASQGTGLCCPATTRAEGRSLPPTPNLSP